MGKIPLGLETLRDPIRGVSFIIAIASLVLAVPFLSYDFTGYAIGNLTQNASNIVGVALFCLGLVGALVYVRKKK